MKIYFTGSLHNKNIDPELYLKIVNLLKNEGHVVQYDHIIDKAINTLETQTVVQRQEYYRKLSKWLTNCDAVVCEISYPSTINIGHELTLALDKDKPVLALYQEGREPGIIQGIDSEKLILADYTEDTISQVLKYGLEEISGQIDVRFNFFISPKIGNYLDWVSKKKRIPRAVYLRRLIEEDMKKNKDFEG